MTIEQPGVAELRLALVLNGGVSLAVWMGGVCHEIDLLRRAAGSEADHDPDIDSDEVDAATLWAQASAGTNVVVDVIAGTSAGGLNGVFLATAVARGGTLDPLKNLWMNEASLDADHLLSPRQGRDGINELLDGDFFHKKIVESLGSIESPGGEGWSGQPVTLITTASAASGPLRQFRDSSLRPFAVSDHRRRFAFEAHGPRTVFHPDAPGDRFGTAAPVNDFDPVHGVIDAVGWAARATASIPGAFDPVAETPTMRKHRILPPNEQGPRLEWLLDGGLLDNAPIEPMLDYIAQRSVSSTWQRTIAYIVPSNEAVDTTADDYLASPEAPSPFAPPWTDTVLKLHTYPGESNLRAGVDRLQQVLQSSRPDTDASRFWRLVHADADKVAVLADGAKAIFPLYRAARAAAGIAEVRALASTDPVPVLRVPEWPTVDEDSIPSLPWVPETFVIPSTSQWRWGFSAADRLVRLLLRSVRTEAAPGFTDAREQLDRCAGRLQAIREVLDDRLRSIDVSGTTEQLADGVRAVYTALRLDEELAAIVQEAAGTLAGVLGSGIDVTRVVTVALTLEVVNGASGLPDQYRPTPAFEFTRFDVEVPDGVFDIDLTGHDVGELLYGTRLGHFAAFGEQRWRHWDWMWGRISGAVHLCRLLGREELTAQIVRAILREEDIMPDAVNARANDLLRGHEGGTTAILEGLRQEGSLAAAVDAALHVAAEPAETSPPVNAAVGVAGSWIATALTRNSWLRFPNEHEQPLLRRQIRALALALRLWIWHRLKP